MVLSTAAIVSVSVSVSVSVCYGAFTLPDTDTDTDGDQQIVTVLNGIVVLVQCEYPHTILDNPFFIGVCASLSVGQCEHTNSVNIP